MDLRAATSRIVVVADSPALPSSDAESGRSDSV